LPLLLARRRKRKASPDAEQLAKNAGKSGGIFSMAETETRLTAQSKLENARGEPVDGSVLAGKVVALYFRSTVRRTSRAERN
jgi:hypothetical protein